MSAKPLEDKTARDKTARDKTAEALIAAARALAPEAVFAEPWEAHAFAVAVALCQAGQFRWAEFQQSLIEEIGAAEKTGRTITGGADYYRHWLGALTRLLDAKGIVGGAELRARIAEVGPPPPSQDPDGRHGRGQNTRGQSNKRDDK
ncbi:MAG TPA: nitrile hydratase accessory protein [Candidatus Binataceae bacterium]|nr:nitrile hydratase accessory protein [Candidatus Binataceae bacterium]